MSKKVVDITGGIISKVDRTLPEGTQDPQNSFPTHHLCFLCTALVPRLSQADPPRHIIKISLLSLNLIIEGKEIKQMKEEKILYSQVSFQA